MTGRYNLAYDLTDRHVAAGHGDHPALRRATSAGQPLPPDTLARVREGLGVTRSTASA